MSATPSPKQLAAQALRELRAAADVRTAEQAKKYFKPGDEVAFFGLDTPAQRRLAAGLHQLVRTDWGFAEALEFCDLMIRQRELEAKNIGLFLLARYRSSFDKKLLGSIESWLAENHCANWAATDALCGEVLGPLVRQQPALTARLKTWTGKRNLWLRRAAAVGVISSARKGEQLDAAYWIAEALFKFPEDLIHKATGWLLREAGKTNQQRLEAFLLAHGQRIPRTTLRYAIERFSADQRKILLEKTKVSS